MRRRRGHSGPGSAAAAALTTLALAAGVAGCGTAPGPDPADVTGSITWWDTSGPTEAPAVHRLVAEFEKEHPGIDVSYVNVDFFEAQQKYRDAVRDGGEVPDVLRADVGWMAGFVQDGLLADLTGTPAVPEPEGFLETTTASVVYDGRTFGAPQVTDPLALLYNKELFAEAGLTRPPDTWEALRDAALEIKEVTGVDGVALNTDPYYALPFLYGEGSDLLDPDRSRITIADEASVRAATTAAELVTSGAARKPPAEDAYGAMQSAFRSGEVAMILDGPWATTGIFEGEAFTDRANLGIAPIPAGSTGERGSPTGGHNLVVSAGTRYPEAAQLFVGFMTAAEQQERLALELGLLPTRKAAYTRAVLSDPVRNSFYFASTKCVPRLSVPEGAELFARFGPRWEAVLRGDEPPAKALSETAYDWQSSLLPGWSVTR
ncbi:extracellular solute-binding protein [Streptomyces sp. JJ38]|uniref:extracellular solute-binding protein n=1 Tax=Streptomyces sp. JJ38 TaxID=2738128 RepID=UPI001C57837B|nr:extracellular solute-binding protein [Streptomyces sp. JJ38]MBW1596498.1 extracellular solute-binding protein [Streptomyces sp. JJ38]